MNINKLATRYEEFKRKRRKHSDIQITDDSEMMINGCEKVISYDENYIKIELSGCVVSVFGNNLSMNNFSRDGVKITGTLSSVEFSGSESL